MAKQYVHSKQKYTVGFWNEQDKEEVQKELTKADSMLKAIWFTTGEASAWDYWKRIHVIKQNGDIGEHTEWAICTDQVEHTRNLLLI